MTQKKQRNGNIECLRFLLMIGICLWHMLVHGKGYSALGDYKHPISVPYSDLWLMALFVPCTNVFMLISGYFGIRLSVKRLLGLFYQGLFYYIITLCILFIVYKLGVQNSELDKLLSFRYLIFHIEPSLTYVWWFLSEYILIMILSPYIEAGLNTMSEKTILLSIGTLLLFNNIGYFFSDVQSGSNFLGLLAIYILGRCVYKYKTVDILNKYRALSLWIISTLILFGLMSLMECTERGHYSWWLLYYNNPLVLLQALGIFFYVMSLHDKKSNIFLFIGTHCFSIYLVTERLGKSCGIYQWWAYLQNHYGVFVAFLPVIAMCAMCLFLDVLRKLTQEKVLGNK